MSEFKFKDNRLGTVIFVAGVTVVLIVVLILWKISTPTPKEDDSVKVSSLKKDVEVQQKVAALPIPQQPEAQKVVVLPTPQAVDLSPVLKKIEESCKPEKLVVAKEHRGFVRKHRKTHLASVSHHAHVLPSTTVTDRAVFAGNISVGSEGGIGDTFQTIKGGDRECVVYFNGVRMYSQFVWGNREETKHKCDVFAESKHSLHMHGTATDEQVSAMQVYPGIETPASSGSQQRSYSSGNHVCELKYNGQIMETFMTIDDADCKMKADAKARDKGWIPK